MFDQIIAFYEKNRRAAILLAIVLVLSALIALYKLKDALWWLHEAILAIAQKAVTDLWLIWIIVTVVLVVAVVLVASVISIRNRNKKISKLSSQVQTLTGALDELRDQITKLGREKDEDLAGRLKKEEIVKKTFKRMMMTAYQITQQTATEKPKKQVLLHEATYLIGADYDGEVERVSQLRAVEQLHFWEVQLHVESEAIPQEFLDEIAFKARDDNGTSMPYMLTENDPHRKAVAIFFLPPLQAGEEKIVIISYKWPGMFNKLKAEGFERASWNLTKTSHEPIGVLRFSFYAHPALGKELTCQRDGYQGGQQQAPGATKHNKLGWLGYTYEITKAPPGIYALRLEVR